MSHEENIKQRVQNQFGKNADKYVISESHAKGIDLDLLLEWLPLSPTWQVLDIATGGGHVAKQLSGHVKQVVATDLTRPMLAAAANHLRQNQCYNVMFVVADAESLPFLTHTFDAVTCRIAAHHFPNPNRFLHEVARVLRPGGKFLFIDNVAPDDDTLGKFMNDFEGMRDTSHVRCLSIREWEALAIEAGLQVEKALKNRKKHSFPDWVMRSAETVKQTKEVEQFICTADPIFQNYFSVQIEQGSLQSLQIDEWCVLLGKPTDV